MIIISLALRVAGFALAVGLLGMIYLRGAWRCTNQSGRSVTEATMANQTTKKAAAAGGVAMAVAVVLAWAVGQAGVDVPGEITAAVATIIGYAGRQLGG